MIRINLLGLKKEARRGARAPAVSLEGAKLTAMALGFVALGLVVVVGHYWYLQREATRLQAALTAAQDEQKRLAQVKAQYEEFQKRKAVLTNRLDVIANLQRAQTGPVEMLNSLANVVQASGPLWLTNFENTGDKVNIEGVAGTVDTVADFIGHLKRSGYFKNVEIKESYQDDRNKDVVSFVFQLSAEVSLPVSQAAGGKKG